MHATMEKENRDREKGTGHTEMGQLKRDRPQRERQQTGI